MQNEKNTMGYQLGWVWDNPGPACVLTLTRTVELWGNLFHVLIQRIKHFIILPLNTIEPYFIFKTHRDPMILPGTYELGLSE